MPVGRGLPRLLHACTGVLLAACGGNGGASTADAAMGVVVAADAAGRTDTWVSATFSRIQDEILTPSCTFSACHGTSNPKKGLSLVRPAFAALVGVASTEAPGKVRVAPGQPGESYLFEKISQDAPTDGERMPPQQPLEPKQIELIRAWIAAGARDD